MVEEHQGRNLGSSSVTYLRIALQLSTILCDCKAEIILRPLKYLSNVDCFQAPTLSLFLQPTKNSEVTNVDHIIDSVSTNTILHYLQKLRREDLKKVAKRAFSMLVHERKSKKNQEVEVGEVRVALIEDDDTKRIIYPLGVIVEMFMGKDGASIVAKVRTSNGILKRPVQRIYPSEPRKLADENIPRVKIYIVYAYFLICSFNVQLKGFI